VKGEEWRDPSCSSSPLLPPASILSDLVQPLNRSQRHLLGPRIAAVLEVFQKRFSQKGFLNRVLEVPLCFNLDSGATSSDLSEGKILLKRQNQH
jgi:hypothetical protein